MILDIYNELILIIDEINKDIVIDQLYYYDADEIEIIESLKTTEINLIDADYIDYEQYHNIQMMMLH